MSYLWHSKIADSTTIAHLEVSSLIIHFFTISTSSLHLSEAVNIALCTILPLFIAAPDKSSKQSSLYWFMPITKRPPPDLPSSVLFVHTDSSMMLGSDIKMLKIRLFSAILDRCIFGYTKRGRNFKLTKRKIQTTWNKTIITKY